MGVLDEIAAAVQAHAARQQKQAQAGIAEQPPAEEPKPVRRKLSRRQADQLTDDYFAEKNAKGYLEELPWLPDRPERDD